jgi:D-alanine-D-alanine ligase
MLHSNLNAAVKNMRILFVSKFSPLLNTKPNVDKNEGVVPIYNFELYNCLKELGLNLDSTTNFEYLLNEGRKYDYIFSILNRANFRNSEILSSSICEYLGKPYLGAKPNIRSIAEDKHLAKILISKLNIPTPEWCVYSRTTGKIIKPTFQPPYFVKPRFGAASENITENNFAFDWNTAESIIRKSIDDGIDMILEAFVPGRNLTLPVISTDIEPFFLPIVEDKVNNDGNILTYKLNRFLGKDIERRIYKEDKSAIDKMHKYAFKIYNEINPIDYYRVDFRLSKKNSIPYFLEFNVCCNLGKHSNIMIGAKSLEIDQSQLLSHIISYSINRQ